MRRRIWQIYDGMVYSFTEKGFQWTNGVGELGGYDKASTLIENLNINDGIQHNNVESFIFDGRIVAKTNKNLVLIKPETDEIELIATNGYDGIEDYTIYNDHIYYIRNDALFAYNIKDKTTDMIISFHENRDMSQDAEGDYFGFENLRRVKFLNGRCFIYIVGLKTYSMPRVAELDLDSKTVVYLTDYFDDKLNTITTFNGPNPVSFDYPNDYSVFIDYGSSAGTVVSSQKKHLLIIFGGMWSSPKFNVEKARKSTTDYGHTLYLEYDELNEIPTMAMIETDEKYQLRIDIWGDPDNIKNEEERILNILKSMFIHDEITADDWQYPTED